MSAQSANCAYFDNMKKIGIKHKHMIAIFSLCYFFDMMDMNLFGFTASSIQATFSLSNEQISHLSSLSFYGMFFGGLLGGWMADKIGRKKALLYNVLIFSLGTLGAAIFSNYGIFALCRFLTGFGVIGMNIIAMVYIAEMMPAHSRGKYQGLMATAGALGIPAMTILSAVVIPISAEAWKAMYVLGGLSVILFPVGLKWLYESPRWLVSKGRVTEADKIVETITGGPSNLASAGVVCVESKTGMVETLKFLFGKKQIGNTLVLMTMAVGCVVGGFYLMNWTTVLFVQMGFDLQLFLTLSILGCLGSPIGNFISSKVSDKGGRKTPIVVMLFLAGLFYILCGIAPTVFTSAFVALLAYQIVAVFAGACAQGATTMYWTYLAENMPNKYRSTASGLIMSVSRLLIGVVTPTVPILFAMPSLISGFFNVTVANALFYFIPAILCLLYGGKTAQKTLEEIEQDAVQR